jgi:DNA-binding NtrC family response regulator
MAEDSPTDAKLVTNALRSTGLTIELERVEDADAMRAALSRGPWDLIISDWSMPSFSAMAALQVTKQSGLDLPFIIVSGAMGEEAAVDCASIGSGPSVGERRKSWRRAR